jgi:Helix-turn-helix.
MDHIGIVIRSIRKEQGLSAEKVAKKLTKPITRQAYEQREKTGSFPWEMVLEVAAILNVEPEIFLNKQAN